MSTSAINSTGVDSPTSTLPRRDIRSDTNDFKRYKDHTAKWEMGIRSSYPGKIFLTKEDNSLKDGEKIRPQKLWSQLNTDRKSHANVTKHYSVQNNSRDRTSSAQSRLVRKSHAHIEARDREHSDDLYSHFGDLEDAGFLYNFDKATSPPDDMSLGGLIERAEKKWVNEQTEKIVRGEYEVLDAEGEIVRGRGRKSPRSRAKREISQSLKVDDDEGFELI